MDFKAKKYKKGDMVRYFVQPENTLGIVKGQDGGKVQVEWVVWPATFQRPGEGGWYPIYKVQCVKAPD